MHRFLATIAAVALSSAAIANDADEAVQSPPQAIALAKARPSGQTGRFEMVVASTGKTPNGTFLNSTADYRGDDNLTFRLRPIVASMLAKKYGAPMEEYLRGKHVVVKGVVAEKPIANTLYGRARSLNRFQHEVDVDLVDQLISVGD